MVDFSDYSALYSIDTLYGLVCFFNTFGHRSARSLSLTATHTSLAYTQCVYVCLGCVDVCVSVSEKVNRRAKVSPISLPSVLSKANLTRLDIMAERLAGYTGNLHLLKGRALDVWHAFHENVVNQGGLHGIQNRAGEKINVLKEKAIDSLNKGNQGDYSHVYR